jgi:hypothetical protein
MLVLKSKFEERFGPTDKNVVLRIDPNKHDKQLSLFPRPIEEFVEVDPVTGK